MNPFATVLFNVCSAITVECCVLYPCCVGVFDMFVVMFRLSGPYELLFLLCFIASGTSVVVSVMLYPCS